MQILIPYTATTNFACNFGPREKIPMRFRTLRSCVTAPPPGFGSVKRVNSFWVACNSLDMVILDSKGIIRSGFTWVRRVASRWSGLKTNGDSVQLPVPATLSITGQHMGADNSRTSHAKVCLCQSKPQHMGRTLKHSSQGGFNPQDATHRDNCNSSNCPFLYNGWIGKNYLTIWEMLRWA